MKSKQANEQTKRTKKPKQTSHNSSTKVSSNLCCNLITHKALIAFFEITENNLEAFQFAEKYNTAWIICYFIHLGEGVRKKKKIK